MSKFELYQASISGYVINFLKKNYWRVASTMTYDDVQQEAYLVFVRVDRLYPDVEDKHFMALFKSAWARQFVDFAHADTAREIECQIPEYRSESGEYVQVEYAGELSNGGELATAIRQAPSEVKAVLNLFLSAPQELFELAIASWRGQDKRMKNRDSKKICKMLGLDENLDVMKMTYDYFS